MKTFYKFLIAAVLAFVFSPPEIAHAQTACGTGVAGCARTTLSAALSAGAANRAMVVASATGITASTSSVNTATNTGGQQYCLIDKELVGVRSISGTTITVTRALKGNAIGHISGAQVICGGGGNYNVNTGNVTGVFLGTGTFQPAGACTRTNQQFLPVFAIDSTFNNGFTYDCLGGKWVQGTLPDSPDATALVLGCNTNIGDTAYSSLGTNTVGVSSQAWATSIYIPKTQWVTGIQALVGVTTTTDKLVAEWYDSKGNVISTSALAGVAMQNTTNAFLNLPFTAAQYVVGPALYGAAVQTNGTNAYIRTVAASTFNNLFSVTASQTFGTAYALTFPATFTAGAAPFVCVYN